MPVERSCQLYQFILHTVIVGTLVVFGVIGNSLAFAVFWKGNLKTSTTFLLMCLSLVDSAMLLTAFVVRSIKPFVDYTGYMSSFYSINPYVCAYVFPLHLMPRTATVWVTVLITVNRYIVVCMPLRASQWCTLSNTKKQLAVVLLLAVLYNIPVFFEYDIVSVASNASTTDVEHVYSKTKTPLYRIIYTNISYAVFIIVPPTCILALLNFRLIKALKTRRRNQLQMQTLRKRHDNSMTLVLVIIVIVSIVCQVPALVNRVLWVASPREETLCGGYQFYFSQIATMFIVLNSAVNFIIYVIFNKNFRDVLIEMVCKRRASGQVVIARAVVSADQSGWVNDTPMCEEMENAEPVDCTHL